MTTDEIQTVLKRRLPAYSDTERRRLAEAYLSGVEAQAIARTIGAGPVPTTLATERAEMLAHVSRALGRLLTEDEVAALLRVTDSAARAVERTMLAVYDDLPELALKAAFGGATRDGRGSSGDIKDGYRIKFSTAEKMGIAEEELSRQGFMWEVSEATNTRHVLLVDPAFPIDEILSG